MKFTPSREYEEWNDKLEILDVDYQREMLSLIVDIMITILKRLEAINDTP